MVSGLLAGVKPIKGRHLGRKKPKRIIHGSNHVYRVSASGKKTFLAKLGAFYNKSKDIAPPPDSTSYCDKAVASLSQMMKNDVEGCCVLSSKGHAVGLWTGNEGPSIVIPTDDEVDSAYQTICGPGDNGCDVVAVLDYMKANGIVMGGVAQTIDDYVAVSNLDQNITKVALEVFGGLDLGINLPKEWYESDPSVPWDVTDSEIVGGHGIFACDYNSDGVVVSTWGSTRLITWAAFMQSTWVEESFALLAPDWYSQDNLAPNGIDVDSLREELSALQSTTLALPKSISYGGTFSNLLIWVERMVTIVGPLAVPLIESYVATLGLSQEMKTEIGSLIEQLLNPPKS